VELPLRVVEGVDAGDGVPVGVVLLVLEGDFVWLELWLLERDRLLVMLGLAPRVRLAEELLLCVLEPLRVLEGVTRALPVPEELLLGVGVGVPEAEAVPVPEGLGEAERLLLQDTEAELDGEAPRVREAEGLKLSVELALAELEGVALPVGELLGL
jgi:hypothetical protein